MIFNYSEDYSFHGEFALNYAVWFEDYTEGEFYKISSESFKVTVIDGCVDPAEVSSLSNLINQEYTIT